jgi:hypothetical protein
MAYAIRAERWETRVMVDGVRQQPDEDDEAFLLRAEGVVQMEQEQHETGIASGPVAVS